MVCPHISNPPASPGGKLSINSTCPYSHCPLIRCHLSLRSPPVLSNHITPWLYKSSTVRQTQHDQAMAFLWILSCLAFAGAAYGKTKSLTCLFNMPHSLSWNISSSYPACSTKKRRFCVFFSSKLCTVAAGTINTFTFLHILIYLF